MSDTNGKVRVASILYEVNKTSLATASLQLSSLSPSTSESDVITAIDAAYETLAEGIDLVREYEESGEGFEGLLREFSVGARGVLTMSRSCIERTLKAVLEKRFADALYRSSEREQYVLLPEDDEGREIMHACRKLREMGFVNSVGAAMYEVAREALDKVIMEWSDDGGGCAGRLEDWIEGTLAPWMESAVVGDSKESLEDYTLENFIKAKRSSTEMDCRESLRFHVFDRLAKVMAENSLSMIQKWPESKPEWDDLRICWNRIGGKRPFATILVSYLDADVLHPGTMTSHLLQFFIRLIRVSRFVDPSGVFLEWTSGSMRECLRARPDTVRCIVAAITNDEDLYEELSQPVLEKKKSGANASASQSLALNEGLSDEDDFDIDDNLIDWDACDEWEPEHIDAPVGDRWRTSRDTIGLFASIYGSGEAIVTQYRAALAHKLLSSLEYDYDHEQSISDIVKNRFGEEAMHNCSIMLKDASDSQAMLKTMCESLAKSSLSLKERELFENFETLVISRYFWPKVPQGDATFKLAPELEKMKAYFETSFKTMKEPRTLKWSTGLGRVKLNLSFADGRATTVDASPLQASILLQFGEQCRWKLVDLCKVLECQEKIVRRNLNVFLNSGVIREVEDGKVYEAVENASDMDMQEGREGDEDEHLERGDESTQDGPEKSEMAVYESYICGMLQNLKSMPLEKIHNMLKIFVKTPVYDKTQDQLAEFLEQLVASGKIEVSSGQYIPAKKK